MRKKLTGQKTNKLGQYHKILELSSILNIITQLQVVLKSKPYDPKKSCWVPEKATGGYLEGLIESIDGEKYTVKLLQSGDVSIDKLQFSVKKTFLFCFVLLLFT